MPLLAQRNFQTHLIESEDENQITTGYDVQIQDIDDSTKKICITADNSVNGVANVYLDADVEKNNKRSSMLVWQTFIKVENTGTVYAGQGSYYESNYLRSDTTEYIPVPIINGYGEVTITSKPEKNTVLTINEVKCDKIYTVDSDYVEISDVSTDENNNSIITISKTYKNENIIANVKNIRIQGLDYVLDGITSDDTNIYLKISGQVSYEANKDNFMELFR